MAIEQRSPFQQGKLNIAGRGSLDAPKARQECIRTTNYARLNSRTFPRHDFKNGGCRERQPGEIAAYDSQNDAGDPRE